MPRLNLTDLIDIVGKSGTPKATKVRELKTRTGYDPKTDFYKNLRDHIVKTHKKNHSRSQLLVYNTALVHPTKRTAYSHLLKGYHKWWGRKSLQWFKPPKTIYSHLTVEVTMNPELGLQINNQETIVKLYFKAEPLNKLKIALITSLMREALKDSIDLNMRLAVLDIRKARLHMEPTQPDRQIVAMANAELAYVESLWNSI